MAKTLLIAATEKEISLLKLPQDVLARLDILISGVGIPNTCINLCRRLSDARPSLIIQVGLAGSFDPEYRVGSAVVVEADCFPELGVMENSTFKSIHKMGLISEPSFFKDEFLINPHHELIDASGLPKVKAGTVMEITTDPTKIKRMTDNLSLKVESMEGAALHQVCLEYELPFIQLRGISNQVGERDKKNWDFTSGMEAATASLKTLLLKGFI